MKTLYIILLSWVCVYAPVMAEPLAQKASLQGKVTDAVDGSPVVGASIYFPLLKQGTVTNAEGVYFLDQLPSVSTTIQVSYVGHQTIVETIDLRVIRERDFVLHENNAMLKEVVVTGLTGNARADYSPAHDGSHGFVKATALCTVAFIDKDKDVVTLYTEVVAIFLRDDGL